MANSRGRDAEFAEFGTYAGQDLGLPETGPGAQASVARRAGAVAIGPVLQGIRRPINDLSRGALVDDIVNTVAITAIQAQNMAATRRREA